MFDIGWTELLVIGIVALIVVGPKDLPKMFRTLGQFTAKARGMAREFQRAMEEAADESGMRDVNRDLRKMSSARNLGLDKLKDATRDFGKWEPDERKKPAASDEKLSEERTEKARKIREATAKKAAERRAAEASDDDGAPKASEKAGSQASEKVGAGDDAEGER